MESKQSFFEKKDQKTFGSAVARSPERSATAESKVFGFFFSKKKALLASEQSVPQAGLYQYCKCTRMPRIETGPRTLS